MEVEPVICYTFFVFAGIGIACWCRLIYHELKG